MTLLDRITREDDHLSIHDFSNLFTLWVYDDITDAEFFAVFSFDAGEQTTLLQAKAKHASLGVAAGVEFLLLLEPRISALREFPAQVSNTRFKGWLGLD